MVVSIFDNNYAYTTLKDSQKYVNISFIQKNFRYRPNGGGKISPSNVKYFDIH